MIGCLVWPWIAVSVRQDILGLLIRCRLGSLATMWSRPFIRRGKRWYSCYCIFQAFYLLHTHVWAAIASYRKGGKKALIRAINAITPVLVFHEEWHGMMLIKTGKKFSSGFEFQFGHSNTALQMFAGIYRDSAGVSCNICRENPVIFTGFSLQIPANICSVI